MWDRDQWQEIAQTLSANKTRTFLTAFGVFWGIFMMIIMMGSGNGLRNGVQRDMGSMAVNSVVMWTRATGMPYQGLPKGRRYNFRNADMEAIEQNVPAVELISPRNNLGGWRGANNVIRGMRSGAFTIYGDHPQYFTINPLMLVDGRLINEKDILEKRKVCIIGTRVVEMLFEKGEDPIGESIQVNGVYFMVVGVIRSRNQGENGDEENQSIFIPFTTFQKAFNYGDIVGWFAFTAAADVKATDAEEQVKTVLRQRHKIHPEDEWAFGSWNREEDFTEVMDLFFGINALSFVVGFFTLLAGAIGVSNIMLVMVKERTQEFGIRRALGATPTHIFVQIILESAVLTILAGILGVISGVWLLEFLNQQIENSGGGGSFTQPGVDIGLVLMALLILISVGLLAGIIPARRAIKVRPITALRDE